MSDTVYVLLWQLGLVFSSWVLGVVSLFAYMIWRMMKDPKLDDSNLTNPVRLLSHVVMHPGDFLKMYYLTDDHLQLIEDDPIVRPLSQYDRPGWYLSRDEISQVVKTRPPK